MQRVIRNGRLARLVAVGLLAGVVACGDVVVGGDGGGGAADTAAGADTGGGGQPATCAAYCDQVLQSCGTDGATAQYPTRAACLAYCGVWAGLPLGNTADQAGNTVGCRTYHATVAGQTAPTTHCPHAGPSGADTCGTWCENYCHLALRNCTGDQQIYADVGECAATCAGFPADDLPGADAGDSVQCRIHYLGLAGAEPPATAVEHCSSGAPDGGDVCVDEPTCEAYCDLVEDVCEAAGVPQYPSDDECLLVCRDHLGIPPGEAGDTDSHTIGCRIYHATVASATTPEVHCVHAGPTGGDECGSWCDNYCHAAQRNCTGAEALYGSAEECVTACERFADGLHDDDEQTRRFTCLIEQLVAAATDPPTSAAAHCPNAAVDAATCQ